MARRAVLSDKISNLIHNLGETLTKIRSTGTIDRVKKEYRTNLNRSLRRERDERRNKCEDTGCNVPNGAINILDNDCLYEIFKRLDVKNLMTCNSVCSRWKCFLDERLELFDTVYIRTSTNLTINEYNPTSQYKLLASRQKLCINEKNIFTRIMVNFLLGKGVSVRHLTIEPDIVHDFTLATLRILISECCSTLVSLNLPFLLCGDECWDNSITCDSFRRNIVILGLVKYHTDDRLQRLKTGISWVPKQIQAIVQFKHLKYLELCSYPRVQHVNQSHLDYILNNMPGLHTLKLSVTIGSTDGLKCTFSSPTLKCLDISDCVNVQITQMDCPELEEFCATGLQCYRRVIMSNTHCMYSVLSKGCPKLAYVNNYRIHNVNKHDFGLENPQELIGKICFCKQHVDGFTKMYGLKVRRR